MKEESLIALPFPEIGVGPSADSVKSSALIVPPLSLVTFLISVNCGATSLLVMVQVTVSPSASVTSDPFCEPPSQDQALGEYPVKLDSLRE